MITEDSREHDRRNVVIIQLIILELLGPKEPIRQPPASSNSHRRQESLTLHISNTRNALDVGILILIHNHVTLPIQLNSNFLKPQTFSVGMPPDRPQQYVHLDPISVVSMHSQRLPLLPFHLDNIRVLVNNGPGFFHPSKA